MDEVSLVDVKNYEAGEKLPAALNLIRDVFARHGRVAVLWSGGKDSMVLLDLARSVRADCDVIFWRAPYMPEKYAFANRVIAEWDLRTFDYPPSAIALCEGNGRIDVMEHMHVGGGRQLILARGTEPYEEGKPFLCGVRDWLARPVGTMAFPWDAILHGHKSVDVDPCSGAVPLEADAIQQPGGAACYFPLRAWTDAEIWDYTLLEGLPVDSGRYDNPNDKRVNSDYFHTCFRCVDPKAGEFVDCPKMGIRINNLSGNVPWITPQMSYCNLRNADTSSLPTSGFPLPTS